MRSFYGVFAWGILLGGVSSLRAGTLTAPFSECPAIGADSSCAIVFVFNADGSMSTLADPSQGPYDSADDTLVGVYNNSSQTQYGFTLSGTGLTGDGYFDFEGDGICNSVYLGFTGSGYCAGAYYQTDPGDYAGPLNVYLNIGGVDNSSGTVYFPGGLAPGAATFLGLEDVLDPSNPPVPTADPSAAPEPASLALLGVGLAVMSLGALISRSGVAFSARQFRR